MNAKNFKSMATRLLVACLACAMLVGCGGGASTGSGLTGNSSTTTGNPPTTTQPTPLIASISPSQATAGGVGFQVAVYGEGFLSTSVVLWNGAPRPSIHSVGNTYLSATISAADIAQAGVVKVSVQNPATGPAAATTSNTADVTLSALRLNVVSPALVSEGSGDTALALTGAGFTSGTVMRWNGSDRPTVVVNDSTINVIVPAADIASANLAEITVATPAPNVEQSNVVLFPIVSSKSGSMERISGDDASSGSTLPGISQDGSMVAYVGKYDLTYKILLKNTCLTASVSCVPSTNIVSIGPDGKELNLTVAPSAPVLDVAARIVAFASNPLGLSGGGVSDVMVRDTCNGVASGCVPATTVPSRSDNGTQVAATNAFPSLSADGRYVAFTGGSSDGSGYGFDYAKAYLFDSCRGATGSCGSAATAVGSEQSGRLLGYAVTSTHSLSSSGRYLAYSGDADPNFGNDYVYNNPDPGLWLKDTCAGAMDPCTPTALQISIGESENIIHGYAETVAVSATGRYVVFAIEAQTVQQGVLLRDTCLGAAADCKPSTVRVSMNGDGKQLAGRSYGVSISDDGRRVVFVQTKDDAYRQREISDILMRDTCFGTTGCAPKTILLSVGVGNTIADGPSYSAMISGDGRFVVFESQATNLVPGDTNGVSDIFRVSTQP